MKIEDFEGTGPEMRPEEFLRGRLQGWAILEGPLGGLQRRASISAQGSHDPAAGTVSFHETWTFDDGQVDTLRWRIEVLGEGRYAGQEQSLHGKARGERAGCAFHWVYTREVPSPEGGTHRLDFDDWFFRIDDTGVIVKGTAGRLGLPFATAHVTYRKV